MGQHVGERRVRQHARARLGRQPVERLRRRLERGQAMQACPDAARRTAREPHASARVDGVHQPQVQLAPRRTGPLARPALGLATGGRQTHIGQGTALAGRAARQAHRGTQVHQTLGIGRHGAAQAAAWQQVFGALPQGTHRRRLADVVGDGKHARQHALDVAVQDGRALAETERGNRRGRRAANAGQGGQHGSPCRKLSAKVGHHLPRTAVQQARAAVVAQTAPQGQYLVFAGVRQSGDIAKALQEARVVRQHGRDLRLLQHDFGKPHPVGVAGALPGQVVAPVPALPGDHALGQRALLAIHASAASGSGARACAAIDSRKARTRPCSSRSVACRASRC